MPQIYEYRGVEGLVYAEVLKDTKTEFTTGTVKDLAGVATIAKATANANEAHYYDNIPAVVITSTGADTVTITASAIPLDVLGEITGQKYDETLGTLIEGERTSKYFAIGYQTKNTNGEIQYVWRFKGMFSIPDQTNNTENEGTDANGQELVYTGINTTHKFVNNENKGAKAIVVNTALGLADVSDFFDEVKTPDTLKAASEVPQVVLNNSHIALEEGQTATLIATTTPSSAVVTWTSSSGTVASVAAGVVSALDAGTTTITAKITVDGVDYTDTCAVTVTEPEA